MSKYVVVGDPHFFNGQLGGKWGDINLSIFEEFVIPIINNIDPSRVFFTGDILDPTSSAREAKWSKGNDCTNDFIDVMGSIDCPIHSCLGNHDNTATFKMISRSLSGFDHRLIDDIQLIPFCRNADDIAQYIESHTACIIHQGIDLAGNSNISGKVLKSLKKSYNNIYVGHQHFHEELSTIHVLQSLFPTVIRKTTAQQVMSNNRGPIKSRFKKLSFCQIYVIDDDVITPVKIDTPYQIVYADIKLDGSADILYDVREQIKYDPAHTFLRVRLSGTAPDVNWDKLETDIFGDFYNVGRIIMHNGTDIAHPDITMERTTLISAALEGLVHEYPDIRTFYDKYANMLELKSLTGQRIMEEMRDDI